MSEDLRSRYPHLKNFVPLPSDINVKLTEEQLDALFPPANRGAIWEFVAQTMQKNGITGILPEDETDNEADGLV